MVKILFILKFIFIIKFDFNIKETNINIFNIIIIDYLIKN